MKDGNPAFRSDLRVNDVEGRRRRLRPSRHDAAGMFMRLWAALLGMELRWA